MYEVRTHIRLWRRRMSESGRQPGPVDFQAPDDGDPEILRYLRKRYRDKVAEIQGGNEKLLNFLTGQVMKASKGKANPKLVTDSLRGKLL